MKQWSSRSWRRNAKEIEADQILAKINAIK